MFGTLRPPRCGPLPVVQSYRQFYCGTCQGLGAHFGHARRGLLNHDAVFMAILADAVQAEPAPPSRCRCPMMPVVFRTTFAPDSVAMRYASAVQMLLADQWLADRGAEGQWHARVARPVFSARPARKAAEHLAALGVELPALRGFEGRQVSVERCAARPEVAAAPTAAVLAMAFEAVALLPGASHAFATSASRRGLAELGAAVGSAIYLLDALEDLDKDLRGGDFNPCVNEAGQLCVTRKQEAVDALETAISTAADLCQRLPWVRHGVLLRAVLRRFTQRCRAARAKAPTRRVQTRGWGRASAMVSAAWAWGISWTAHAAPGADLPPDLGTPDVGTPDVGSDAGSSDATGDLIDDPEPGCSACDGCGRQCNGGCDQCVGGCGRWLGDCMTGCGECARCPGECGLASLDCFGKCGQGCGDCTEACGGGCSECGTGCSDGCGWGCDVCGDGCGDCGQGCGDCGNGCGDCGQGCGDCGNGCGDCGQGCNGCGQGCDGCGQGCNGCGQGCDGCGQGCNGCGHGC